MTDEQFYEFRASILRELDAHRGAVVSELGRLSKKVDETKHIAQQVFEEQIRREHDQDRYRRRLTAAEEEVARLSKQATGPNWERDPRDITGVHNLKDREDFVAMRSKFKEDKKRAEWSRQQKWVVAGAVFAILFTAFVTACVTTVASRVDIAPKHEGKVTLP